MVQIIQEANTNNELDSTAAELLLKTIDINIDLETIKEFKDGKERYNMCKAIDDMKNDARNEGYKLGMDDGYKSGVGDGYISGIKSSIASLMESLNMSLEQAMDALKIKDEMRKNLTL